MALHTHSSKREDPGEVRLHVCRMHSFASIYAGYDRLPLCHAGAREKVCPAEAVLRTDKRAESTLSAVSRMCLADLTAASARPFNCDQYGEDVMWLNWYLLANV